ncbi:MAG: hypothetical protein NW703_14615 [Nitrospiraceae bacterium]
MIRVEHWNEDRSLLLAESKSGIRVTRHPLENLVRHVAGPWPPPEILQKLYASTRFSGRTAEDDEGARSGLGYYCDLQSMNSEDAVTWSFFGTLAYMSPSDRNHVCARLFVEMGLALPGGDVTVWLWRRIPHPEKPESSGGPEIDFGFLSPDTIILGEGKWNSSLGTGQGVNKDRSQLDLRLAYCDRLVPRLLPGIGQRIVLGIGRTNTLLPSLTTALGTRVHNLSWSTIVACFEPPLADELRRYLKWRDRYASPVAKHRAATDRQGPRSGLP